MFKKALIAAAVGVALLGSIGTASADYVTRDGVVVRSGHRVVNRPVYRHRGYHRVVHHGRTSWERNRF